VFFAENAIGIARPDQALYEQLSREEAAYIDRAATVARSAATSQQTLREIWTGQAYRDFRKALLSEKPPTACASCGLRWSL
jgi:Iron-sulfur cluster-binding domain